MATTFKRTVRYYCVKGRNVGQPALAAIQAAKKHAVEVDFELSSPYRGAYGTTILYKVPGFFDEVKVSSLTIDITSGDGIIQFATHDHWYGPAADEIARLTKAGWKITAKRQMK